MTIDQLEHFKKVRDRSRWFHISKTRYASYQCFRFDEPAKPAQTAAQVIRFDTGFADTCKALGIEPTKRQARKYIARRGRRATHRYSTPMAS